MKTAHTTNIRDTFIQVADDCPAPAGVVPPLRGGALTVAGLQYAMIMDNPYAHSSDDVIFATSAVGRSLDPKVSDEKRAEARALFFSRGQACMRASPLGKTFGWGVHADANGRLTLVCRRSARYRELTQDPAVAQVKAMRSKRV